MCVRACACVCVVYLTARPIAHTVYSLMIVRLVYVLDIYEGKSTSKLQKDIELKQIRVLI
jgi:hypothetical protein